jgi:hypothetical protein
MGYSVYSAEEKSVQGNKRQNPSLGFQEQIKPL